MSAPRKHHYLPQFYLRGFTGRKGQLCHLDKQTSRHAVVALRDAAAQRDYHRLDAESIEDSNILETELARIEAQFAVDLREVIKSGIASSKVRQRLCELVSHLRCRVPAMKTLIEQGLRDAARITGLLLDRNGELPGGAGWLESALRSGAVTIDVRNWACMWFMFRLAADPALIGPFMSMRQSIHKAPDNCTYVTCDQPVAVFNPSVKRDDPYGVDLGHPATVVSLPLSSKQLLTLDWNKSLRARHNADPDEVEEFNRRTVIMASAYVFAPPEHRAYGIEVVRKYRDFFAGPQSPETLDVGTSFFQILSFKPVMTRDQYGND